MRITPKELVRSCTSMSRPIAPSNRKGKPQPTHHAELARCIQDYYPAQDRSISVPYTWVGYVNLHLHPPEPR
ncbi:hypothetical protein VTH06DRAFT_8197 [Thermothelomyces fergusii]